MKKSSQGESTRCYHCGDVCLSKRITSQGHVFCCTGCKTVYEILSAQDMCDYYTLENTPGITMKGKRSKRFEYLEDPEVERTLLDFKNDDIAKVHFYLPQIHCSACLWLLENLYKLRPGIQESRVNFLKKEAYITYEVEQISLREVVELLASVGYEPEITLADVSGDEKKRKPIDRRLLYQVGLAGFAFGNIMLLSLPEYFGLDSETIESFGPIFGWVNFILATPVAIYSGRDYFVSAWNSLKVKRLNIDVPIALGVIVLYLRSTYEVFSETGAGYFDSLCGLLFFLLLGRVFQQLVYHRLSFDRDYRSYFPVSVHVLKDGEEVATPIQNLQKGDRIFIRHGELIPVDGVLMDGKGQIDNSFATGESDPEFVQPGSRIYAGGRQVGEGIEVEVVKPLSQSKLTRLWNEYAEREQHDTTFSKVTDDISQWFTPIILILAIVSALMYLPQGWHKAVEVVSAVLIVACPCALALAAPFTFGHVIRWLGKQSFYMRDVSVIEHLSTIKHVIFDKTGTLTSGAKPKIEYQGAPLDEVSSEGLWNLVHQSMHPVSRMIKNSLPNYSPKGIEDFNEIPGEGIEGEFEKLHIALKAYRNEGDSELSGSATALYIGGKQVGIFTTANQYRRGLKKLFGDLGKHYSLSLISGDNAAQQHTLKSMYPYWKSLVFNASPKDKLEFSEELAATEGGVMMVGDGLNDAGALRAAKVGLSVAEEINTFTPASDVIMAGGQLQNLSVFMRFVRQSRSVVYTSFVISFLYNLIGLAFAMSGKLSPVVAAILMPVSSITVVAFVSAAVWVLGLRSQPLLNREE